jgi:hypothetical protein
MEEAGGFYNPGVVGSGAGGSSFVSGYNGCDAITEESTENNIIHTGNSLHYSGLSFIDAQMISGNSSMPSYSGTGTMTGNTGNGYARITFISDLSSDSSLKSLTIDKGSFVEEFSSDVLEYTIKLKEDEYIVNFDLETSDPLATIDESEYINISVPAGNSKHKINVYAQDGTRTQYIINFERDANSYEYIEGVTINGKYYKFIDGVYDYKIVLPYNEDDLVEITTDYLRPSQNIVGLGSYILKQNTYETDIIVTSEDKLKTNIYHLDIVKENSNKLKSLVIAGIQLNPEFDPDVQEYSLTLISTITDVNIATTTYDTTSKVAISGDKNIPEGESQILITVSNSNLTDDLVYTINVNSETEIKNDYSMTGNYQTFTAALTGKYKIELWGAQGEVSSVATGFGAYTSGEIELDKGQVLYVYVGASGTNGGYNGGGGSYSSRSGGGATDVRLVSGVWNDTTSLRSRIMVAGGGGGHSGYNATSTGASAGGLTGYTGTNHPSVGYRGYGGSQTAGGSGSKQSGGFGYGGTNGAYSDGHIGGGRRRWLLWWWWYNLALTRWPEVHHSFQVMTAVTQ